MADAKPTDHPPACCPYGTERQAAAAVCHVIASPAEAWGLGLHKLLEDACTAAGVSLASYDQAILLWLAGWEPATCRCRRRDHHPRARERRTGMSSEGIPDDLARLRERHPGWTSRAVWTSAASGPDRRRLTAIREGIILSAWGAAALSESVRREEDGR